MIAYVQGILTMTSLGSAVVECGGIGYEVMMADTELQKLPPIGEAVQIHTYLNYNENSGISLFGFLRREDLNMFKQLITVSGIGPKGALAILSVLPADSLRFAILAEDAKSIAKAPGIGLKTAQKMVLELKDKVSLEETIADVLDQGERAENLQQSAAKEEAIQALVALGYSRTEAAKAVAQVPAAADMTVDEILGQSLRYF